MGFTVTQKRQMLDMTNGRCAHCRKQLTIQTMTVEHVYPVSKEQCNALYNTLPLCRQCNWQKANYVTSMDYYQYINSEHVLHYWESLEYFIRKNHPGNLVMPYTETTFHVPNLLYARHKKQQNAIYMSITIRRAFPQDAEMILHYIQRRQNKAALKKEIASYYTNEYELLNDIKDGNVYLCENRNDLCGVIAYTACSNIDTQIVQAENIADIWGLKIATAMTAMYLSDYLDPHVDLILNLFFQWSVNAGILPLYCDILTNRFVYKQNILSLPCTLNGVDRHIETFTAAQLQDMVQMAIINKTLRQIHSITREPIPDIPQQEMEKITEWILKRENIENLHTEDQQMLQKYRLSLLLPREKLSE